MRILKLIWILIFLSRVITGQSLIPEAYNVVWEKQSANSYGSMPCGGGDIGLNVWVENGEFLFYLSRSGTFDENNEFVKLGRIRIKMEPNPLKGNRFRQELHLEDGYVSIRGNHDGNDAVIKIWVDVYRPVIHVDINCSKPVELHADYESWRFEDRELRGSESFANSYKWAPIEAIIKKRDSIRFDGNTVLFYHHNQTPDVFDVTVSQQGMDAVKDQLVNPLRDLTFGGLLLGRNMEPVGNGSGKYLDTEFRSWKLKSKSTSRKHELAILLQTGVYPGPENWVSDLLDGSKAIFREKKNAEKATLNWWNSYWERSYIFIEPGNQDLSSEAWQVGRNYQLFRYMLGCNAYGSYPTKFNGGLFTFDPRFTDPSRAFTPDFRNWGGGTFTAQNQRLVYFPMLASGDFDMMKPQLDFYLRILRTAELRSQVYWGHEGACFTEQIENFGLPNSSEYGWNRPEDYDPGMQYNAWLEHQWDTSLEFCLMMLEQFYYSGTDISAYIPFIISCLRFFDEHYQYLAGERGSKKLDQDGHLVLYPGSACETYKMAYNASSTVAGLQVIVAKVLELPVGMVSEQERDYLLSMKQRIPPIEYRTVNGKPAISPAKLWERVNNTEAPQLYPVYPWGIFGVGRPGLDTAINTYFHDPDVVRFRDHISWKQYNIFAARLGLAEEAWHYTLLKLKDSGRRFPAFWGPGFDWVPDHNWGGSGMIGLQEMLLQSNGNKIYLFPAWPAEVDVRFRLHAPGNTTVEAEIISGEARIIRVVPESRAGDVVIMKSSN